MNVDTIAEVAYKTNRAYCETIGDFSQPSWQNIPDCQHKSCIGGVEFRLSNPDLTAEDQHNAWLNEKFHDGWKYGEVKDPEKKEHPCCVSYDELPNEQKVKDALFIGVVEAMKILL